MDFADPFNVQIITQVIAESFFGTGPDSLGTMHTHLFKSSHPDYPDEKEIPEAILGVACAVVSVHRSLGAGRKLEIPHDDLVVLENLPGPNACHCPVSS